MRALRLFSWRKRKCEARIHHHFQRRLLNNHCGGMQKVSEETRLRRLQPPERLRRGRSSLLREISQRRIQCHSRRRKRNKKGRNKGERIPLGKRAG